MGDNEILARLDAADLPEPVKDLIRTALPADTAARDQATGTTELYLSAISVQGFRGIGQRTSLTVAPRPGLTLVIGRNGSGKSSFAEAAELALTGATMRWSSRPAVYRQGWRNLHHSGPASIAVDLITDGDPATRTVTREWQPTDGLDEAEGTALDQAAALNLYRPFLSYTELGALISGKPSEMHDALLAICGLTVLTDAEQHLTEVRRLADNAVKQSAGEQDLAAARERLHRAQAGVEAARGTQAEDARRLTSLLTTAVEHYRQHPDEPCPVCQGRALDEQWAQAAQAELLRLSSLATAADQAHHELAGAEEALRRAENAAADRAAATHARRAISWLRATADELRNQRLAPFADQSARVWEMLRQQSNVELGPVRLTGSGTKRQVSLDVTVDGVPGAALGVMSQGELHALGLALFLPRATAQASPFRFLVIDDPVQSMDPAKVDGLARLLAAVAATRQVLVFTHDDRLPEAVRRLALDATIWAVTRHEGSIVELSLASDPVSRYLEDARAMARTDRLPRQVRGAVTALLCRDAIEAACHEKIRARQIAAGVRHADVDRLLEQAQSLKQVAALALFGDARRGSEVAGLLRQQAGPAAAEAFQAANDGVHGDFRGDPRALARDAERVCALIRGERP